MLVLLTVQDFEFLFGQAAQHLSADARSQSRMPTVGRLRDLRLTRPVSSSAGRVGNIAGYTRP